MSCFVLVVGVLQFDFGKNFVFSITEDQSRLTLSEVYNPYYHTVTSTLLLTLLFLLPSAKSMYKTPA